MSKYTTELRYLIETGFDLELTEYPIFDEAYRNVLNTKLLNYYKFREIGMETPALFREYLKRSMDDIMPYYNQLYKSELIEFNPMYDYEKWEDSTRDVSGTGTNEGNTEGVSNATNKDVFSDTPQGLLGLANIDGDVYATTVNRNRNDSINNVSQSSENVITQLDKYVNHVHGNTGMKNYSILLQDFRKTFLNIDSMIINDPEITNLFMGVW